MISNTKIYLVEFVMATLSLVIAMVLRKYLNENAITVMAEASELLCSGIFQLNLAIVVAFSIGLIMSKSFEYKGRKLKKIARGSTLLMLVNSTVMIFYPVLGVFSLAIVIPAMTGNLIKFWSIAKNILEVL